jgi:hypothetical protein
VAKNLVDAWDQVHFALRMPKLSNVAGVKRMNE